jgi:pimeloyl-ACP methyl ester carboxylesterase
MLRRFDEAWGDGTLVEMFMPSFASDPAFREWWGRFERLSMSPGSAVEAMRVNYDIDVRPILSSVHIPTLVIQNEGDLLPREAVRYVAEQIPNARFVVLPGRDHFGWREEDKVTEEVEEFLTGQRTYAEIGVMSIRVRLDAVIAKNPFGSTRCRDSDDAKWRRRSRVNP